MKKRVALEITGAMGGGGYRRYAESIVRAMAEEGPENEYFLFGVFRRGFPERATSLNFPKSKNFHWELKRFPQGLLFPVEEWLGVRYQERILSRLGIDVVHGLGSRTPKLDRIPSTLTLHYSGYWDFGSAWDNFYFNGLTERSVRQAGKVIAISQHCKREAVKEWGTDPDKIAVIPYGGPGEAFKPAERPDDGTGPKRPYFLFVGITRPQKNPWLLAQAYARLIRAHPELPHRLVFAGGHGPEKPRLDAFFESEGLSGRVEYTGLIPQSSIHGLYQRAFACVCPSTEEGFALPVVEAMGCGVPVVGVGAGALPETIGDAGLVTAPEPGAMSQALERLVLEPGLRDELARRGFEQAKRFDWNRSARETLAVYDELVATAR